MRTKRKNKYITFHLLFINQYIKTDVDMKIYPIRLFTGNNWDSVYSIIANNIDQNIRSNIYFNLTNIETTLWALPSETNFKSGNALLSEINYKHETQRTTND